MPVVPSPLVPSVTPTPSTGIPYQSSAAATPAAFGAEVGAAEQKLGAAVEGVGDVLSKHALKMQEDVNASIAKDLFLQGDIEVGKLTVDYNSLEGLNRVNAYPQYVKDIEAVRNKLKASAPNDDVSKRFDQDFARRVGYSIVDGARLASTANKQYQNQTSAAVRSNTMSHIAMNSQDDARFETETQIGLETFKREDEYRGSSPEVQQQKDRAYLTEAWATRLQSMSKNDPLRARDLLEKNKDKMDGGKVLQMQDFINQQIINVDTRVSSDKIIQSGALVSPELKDAVKRFEGYSEKPYSDYKQTSSGYGTKAQPGDENIPPEQRKAIYEQRLDNELAKAANIVDQFAPGLPSGTRNALISLTYNAGSAWTSDGLGQAVRSGDMEEAKRRFVQYNKAGGQTNDALLGRRYKEVDWFGGDRVESDPTSRLTSAMNAAKERAIEVFPNDPGNQARYLDALQSRIKTDNSVMEAASRQMQLDMRNTVQKELVNDQSVTSYDRLSPTAKQAYDLSPPSQQDVFNRQMLKNATADVPMTAERQALYDNLYGESKLQPDKFMARNITELDLPRASKSKLAAMQTDRAALLQKGVKLSGAMSEIQPLLNDAGIGKSATDQNKNAEYNKFAGVLEQQLEKFEEENKRPPNNKEVREMGKALLRDTVTGRGSFGGLFGDRTSRAYEVVADPTVTVTLNAEDPQKHYDSLPRGARFIGPDGKPRIKP